LPVRAAEGPVEWLTFPAPDDAGMQYRVNVSFLLSTYRCIYGCGCPSLERQGPSSDLGCCELGVDFMDDDDFDHVAAMTAELTPADFDRIDEAGGDAWYYTDKKGVPVKTAMVGGACIFLNREGGPTGKPGCAFHHLAERTGRHPADTKPEICWSVPINFSAEEPFEPDGRETMIVSAFSAGAWGGIHWWCIDTPDAYIAKDPVYLTFEYELRKQMGDESYERMVELLREIPAPRYPMPGQLRPKSLPIIS
jgi:hypothetical protein